MVVGIVGSRDYPNLTEVAAFVRRLARKYPDAVVVSGGAPGVDQEAETRARAFGLDVVSYRCVAYRGLAGKVDYRIRVETSGDQAATLVGDRSRIALAELLTFPTFAGAAHERNRWIVEDVEQLVAFWDGRSNGTRYTLERGQGSTHLGAVGVHVFTPATA